MHNNEAAKYRKVNKITKTKLRKPNCLGQRELKADLRDRKVIYFLSH